MQERSRQVRLAQPESTNAERVGSLSDFVEGGPLVLFGQRRVSGSRILLGLDRKYEATILRKDDRPIMRRITGKDSHARIPRHSPIMTSPVHTCSRQTIVNDAKRRETVVQSPCGLTMQSHFESARASRADRLRHRHAADRLYHSAAAVPYHVHEMPNQLRQHLTDFVAAYNVARLLKTLRPRHLKSSAKHGQMTPNDLYQIGTINHRGGIRCSIRSMRAGSSAGARECGRG